MRQPTIYETLRAKIGREPTNAELNERCREIIRLAHIELAEKGKLKHQRGRA